MYARTLAKIWGVDSLRPQVLVFASRKPRIDHQVEILSCVRFDSFAENPCVINFFVNV